MATKPIIIASLGRRLLDQQLWCWGQDVAREQRNGLVEYGFERRPPPRKHSQVPSIYVWRGGTEQILLRGFGVIYSRNGYGRIFLQRYSFSPLLLTSSQRTSMNAWTVDDLGEVTAPQCATEHSLVWRLTADCCHWIRRYEYWVSEHWGSAYRDETIQPWKLLHAKALSARDLGKAWSRLGDACSLRQERYARRAG